MMDPLSLRFYLLLMFLALSSGTTLIVRNPGFISKEFTLKTAVAKSEEFWLIILVFPIFILVLARLVVSWFLAAWNYYWFENEDRGPVFAGKFVQFSLSLVAAILFVVTIIVQNSTGSSDESDSDKETLGYFVLSRMTAMNILATIYMYPVRKFEVFLYRYYHFLL